MERPDILAKAHLEAAPYLANGEWTEAFAAFTQELKNHHETKEHPGINIGFAMIFSGLLKTTEEMRKHLRGFH